MDLRYAFCEGTLGIKRSKSLAMPIILFERLSVPYI